MESNLLSFTNDLKTLLSFHDFLPTEDFYIAGLCRQASAADIEQIVLLMVAVEEAVVLGKISSGQKDLVFYSLSEGKVSEASRMFRDLTESPVPVAPSVPRMPSESPYLLAAQQSHTFTQAVEIGGRMFARNPYTGEITTPQDAEAMESSLRVLVEKEEEKKRVEEWEQSEELARKLQGDWEQEGLKEEEETVCQICLSPISESDLLPLDSCGHLFHPPCIREHIELSITSSHFPVTCPYRGCSSEVSILDIKERLSEDMIEKFEEFSFKHFVGLNKSSLFCCPTPDCKYVFQYACEEQFQCPVCSKHYCLRCQVEYHEGMTCEQYRKVNAHSQEDDMFLLMAQGSRFKQCPNCKFWVEKTEGCDHMVCRCQFEFCYACGGVYMACECINNQRMRRPQRLMGRRAAPPQPANRAGRRPARRGAAGVPRRRVWK